MNTLQARKLTLILFLFGLSTASAEVDGLEALSQASERMVALRDSFGASYGSYTRNVQRFAQEGIGWEEIDNETFQEAQIILQRLVEASPTTRWTPLDSSKFLPQWRHPVSIMAWNELAIFASARMRVLTDEARWEEAVELMRAFDRYGAYLRVNGTFTSALAAYGSRQLLGAQYLRLVKRLPEPLLLEQLGKQRRFLEEFPSPAEKMDGEFAYAINSTHQIFDRFAHDEQGEIARNELFQKVAELPGGEKWVAKWKVENTFEFQDLREKVLQDLRKFEPILLESFASEVPYTDEMWKERIQTRLDEIYKTQDDEDLMNLDFTRSLDRELLNAIRRGEDPRATIDRLERQFHRTLLEIFLPHAGTDESLRTQLAHDRLVLVNVAGEVYRRQHGTFPEKLGMLSDEGLVETEHLKDPFTGKNFLLFKDGAQWRPYSVGKNLQDDGGVDPRKDRFVFEVE